ncbi:hypothetical protein NECAME_16049 [Necator americanus]|uniref:Signal peptidase complex subunit 1 n=1 Tax=Necator americanus TaxID=51031 RepID=W2TXW1_NECAM|nr:hypothetical protein NECAME_16049 [Necator americanus]ETN86900.1 hypothetical protein NECAME_16049 [Necator americanus]
MFILLKAEIISEQKVIYMQVIIVLSGIIGFLIGFSTQQLSHAIYTVLAGAALSAVIVLPPWPFLFRKNPITWQPVSAPESKETKKTK